MLSLLEIGFILIFDDDDNDIDTDTDANADDTAAFLT